MDGNKEEGMKECIYNAYNKWVFRRTLCLVISRHGLFELIFVTNITTTGCKVGQPDLFP